jgi:hypothetical protein
MASLAMNSRMLLRTTARPSARRLYGVLPAPLSCSSQRCPAALTTSPSVMARPSPSCTHARRPRRRQQRQQRVQCGARGLCAPCPPQPCPLASAARPQPRHRARAPGPPTTQTDARRTSARTARCVWVVAGGGRQQQGAAARGGGAQTRVPAACSCVSSGRCRHPRPCRCTSQAHAHGHTRAAASPTPTCQAAARHQTSAAQTRAARTRRAPGPAGLRWLLRMPRGRARHLAAWAAPASRTRSQPGFVFACGWACLGVCACACCCRGACMHRQLRSDC